MSKKDSKSIESIRSTLDDEKYKLIAFIAIGEDGCKQICYGAETRADLVMISGELQMFIYDIFDRLNQTEKMEKIQELLVAVRESTDEGEDDVRVLN